MNSFGRLRKKSEYGPLCQQTLQAVLKRELMTHFGFENMSLVADLLIQRFLAVIEEYAPPDPVSVKPGKRVRPYQALVLAVDKNERFGYGKRMERCQLVPVQVHLITPDELQQLAGGATLPELRPIIAARILKEAYDQGGVLSFSTVGLLTGLRSPSQVAKVIGVFRAQNPDVVLPHSGTVFDLGPTLTHKRAAVLLKNQGLLEQEIARRINHHPSAVARYNNDHERVIQLWRESKSSEMISFITGLSMSVVKQYIDLQSELEATGREQT